MIAILNCSFLFFFSLLFLLVSPSSHLKQSRKASLQPSGSTVLYNKMKQTLSSYVLIVPPPFINIL